MASLNIIDIYFIYVYIKKEGLNFYIICNFSYILNIFRTAKFVRRLSFISRMSQSTKSNSSGIPK